MIDDLDRTLEALLKQHLPADMVSQVEITFATPNHEFPPQSVKLPAIDLFLYDIRENTDLRSNEWLLDRPSTGAATRYPPQARIDCSYLITVWAEASVPNSDEHHVLGEVMAVLLRYPTIPAPLLQGRLKGQAPPLPSSALAPSQLQSWGDFWQGMGGKPKVAINYTVTIGIDVRPPLAAGPPVRDKQLRADARVPVEE